MKTLHLLVSLVAGIGAIALQFQHDPARICPGGKVLSTTPIGTKGVLQVEIACGGGFELGTPKSQLKALPVASLSRRDDTECTNQAICQCDVQCTPYCSIDDAANAPSPGDCGQIIADLNAQAADPTQPHTFTVVGADTLAFTYGYCLISFINLNNKGGDSIEYCYTEFARNADYIETLAASDSDCGSSACVGVGNPWEIRVQAPY